MAGKPVEKSEPKTPVIFRIDVRGEFKGQVTALFPTLPATYGPLLMTCYGHVGQHSAASWAWYGRRDHRPATVEEAAPLKAELESIGYVLEVCQRVTRAHRRAFAAQLAEYAKVRS